MRSGFAGEHLGRTGSVVAAPGCNDGLVRESKWQRRQRRAAETLLGAHITGWTGIEMAIVEAGPDGSPLFAVDGVDCLQLWRLELETVSELKAITTCQNDDLFGLQIESRAPRSVQEMDGIFRRRSSPSYQSARSRQ